MAMSTIKISDLGRVVTGKTPPTQSPEYWGGEYCFITPTDIKDDSYTVRTERSVSNSWSQQSPQYLLPEGTTCYVCIGATIGKNCYVDKPSFSNQQINAVIPDTVRFNPKYVYFLLNTISEEVKNRASGAATPIVNKSSFSEISIKVHEKDQQDLIVNILENYDNLIENNNRRITILEEMAQSLYREWFVNFRYPNHEDILDADGKQKLIDSPLGEIPEGWEIKYIKDIGFINTGKTPSKKKEENYSSRDIPFIKTPDMHGGMFIIKTKEMLSKVGADSQKSKYIPNWAICVSCIGTAGVVSISTQISQTNQQINTFIPKSKKHTEFMYFSFKSLKQTIQNYGATGATMTNLSKGKFEALEIVFPEESLLVNFHRITNPIFKQIQVLSSKNENLKQQRDILLPKLISGQIQLKE